MKKEAWGKEKKKIKSIEERGQEEQHHGGKRTRRTGAWRKEKKKGSMEVRGEEKQKQ